MSENDGNKDMDSEYFVFDLIDEEYYAFCHAVRGILSDDVQEQIHDLCDCIVL